MYRAFYEGFGLVRLEGKVGWVASPRLGSFFLRLIGRTDHWTGPVFNPIILIVVTYIIMIVVTTIIGTITFSSPGVFLGLIMVVGMFNYRCDLTLQEDSRKIT